MHEVPQGPVYLLETQKAPLWTIAKSMTLIGSARAPRKTMVFGTVSDYSGKGGEIHRKVARSALDVADRVIFVGPQASHVSKLRRGDVKDRLFVFMTSFQASEYLAKTAIAGELIHIKASITDHLERIMLSRFDGVTSWKERCRVEESCLDCANYRIAHPPPFGVGGEGQSEEFLANEASC